MEQRGVSDGYSSDVSDLSEHPSTTTISTVAVQAGNAKIVLAILRSNEWIRVRIQQMEPDLMDVGSTLEEARALRKQHDELLRKLNLKQKDVTELLARADDLATQSKSYQEVYAAMAESLGEAWKDLNAQLEFRKMLLDQSIAFHESAQTFSVKMEQAQGKFASVGLAQDVETARRLLQQHQDMKKGILEASMSTLQEGQSLLDRIREMGMHADVQNRHATTAACYGIESLLELLHDRRRHLEELWLNRKIKLEQCLQLLLLDAEVKKVNEWYATVGDQYLSKKDLGDSLPAAQQLQLEHMSFELQAKEIQETVLRLVRTADQLVHSAHYDAEGVKQRLKVVDSKCENFMVRLDARRKNVSLATSFFSQAQTALLRLDEIEVELTTSDLPRNSAALAERHAYLSNAIVEASAPALREGRILLERVGREDPGVKGVSDMVTALQERCTKLEEMCKTRYEGGERSKAAQEFQEKYAQVNSWFGQIGQATLSLHRDMGADLYTAKDFLEIHNQLDGDMKDKRGDLEALSRLAAALVQSGDPEGSAAEEKTKILREQWDLLARMIQRRLKLGTSYVMFHKKAQQLALQMDSLEQYLKIEKIDPAEIKDEAIKHKEEKYSDMNRTFSQVEGHGKMFVKEAKIVTDDEKLDTRRAITVVETTIQLFSERKYLITDYYEHWKVHVNTGKEFKTQWHQFVQDARKTIDWIMKTEKELFVPYIAGHLGRSMADAKSYQEKLDKFAPTVKKAQSEIEEHLKTAEMLSLKGDTRGGKEQIVNELLKVHTRFQARVNEYQVLINMTSRFFKNLQQLDKLIEDTEKEYKTAELPKEVIKAETLLREHEANRDKMKQLISFSAEEGEQIVVRVRQQDSEAIAKDEVQKVLQMTEERRKAWEKSWEDQRSRLEQNLQLCQFYFDLKGIHNELDELHNQLRARHGNYGSSLASVKMTSQAFGLFEASVQPIEKKIQNFVSTAEMMIREQHYDSRRIRHEVEQVQRKWTDFYTSIGEYRNSLDDSKKYFELQEKSEEWIGDSAQLLNTTTRKATECSTSDSVLDLIKMLDSYRADGAPKQDDRLGEMERIAVTLYGQVQGPQKMEHVVEKNRDLMDSFMKAIQELAILRDNLLKKEQILSEMDRMVESKAGPKGPKFVTPLTNAEITEGQKFTFECRLVCDAEPKIQWYKDDIPLASPDYETSFFDGTAKLTIEETFSEDSAKYTCKAVTTLGSAETSATLKVKETHQKIQAPEFTKNLKSQDVPEGTQLVLECSVTGIPAPTVSWFHEEQNIDQNPEYIISKVNGTCSLKIRKVLTKHTGRFICKATNPGGEANTGSRINVICVQKPVFTQPLQNALVQEGKPVRLQCHFQGEPQPQIQWMRGDTPIIPSSVFKVIVENTYTALDINEVFPEDTGTFTVIAKNMGGENRTSCNLSVEGMYSASDVDLSMASDVEPSKPRVVKPLKNCAVLEGSRARLDCVITAQPEPEVIWYHNDRPVKESKDFQLLFEGDRCSLIIREVYLEDSGEYRCTAKNKHGMAESKCRLVVDPLSELSDVSTASGAPSEVVPPKFTQLLKDLEGIEGQKVRFDCRVIGHPNPEIKWFRENQEIVSSPDFQISSQRELHSLTIPEVFNEDRGNYMVRATNQAGEAKCYATLIVKPSMEKHMVKTRLVEMSHTVQKKVPVTPGIDHRPPEFGKLFNDMRVKAGQPCRIEAVITGNPKPRVSWYFNNEPVVSPDYQISCYMDTHSLYIPEVFDEDAGRFSVVAENESGKATCSALLVVVEDTDIPKPPSPPQQPRTFAPKVIQQEPVVPQAVAPVAAAPKFPPPPPPAPVAPSPIKPVAPPVPKAAPPPPPPPVPAPFQQVDVTMELPVPPKFIEPLKNLAAEEGTRVTFQGVVEGKPAPTIKWFKEGNEMKDSADFEISFINGRVKLNIPEVFEEDAGQYTCEAKNPSGTDKSTAELIVKASMIPPEFSQRLQTHEVREGEAVRFTVRVSGRPPPDITWYREGSQIISSPDFEIIREGEVHSLYIPEVFYEDSGKFSVQAKNPAGQASCTAELIVEAPSPPAPPPKPPTPPPPKLPPQFTKPLSNVTARESERVVLECHVNPVPEPEKVQWYRNEVEIQASPDYQISYNNGVCMLVIAEVFPEDAGKFTCTITVEGMPNSTVMYLKVEPSIPPAPPLPRSPAPVEASPVFEHKLVNQPLQFGLTAYFECKVHGYPPPEILWTRKGHPLVDKTRYKSTYDQYNGITTLTILNLCTEDEGEYTCTAINSQGEASTSALLLGPDRYADWLRDQQADKDRDRQKDQQRAMVSELEKRLEKPPTPRRTPEHFYRPPPVERRPSADQRVSDYESDHEGFKVSHFEKRLMKEVDFRDGKVDPKAVPHIRDDREAFDESVPTSQMAQPQFDSPLKNFQLMEGSDATFVTRVTGNPRPNIQWFHNGRLLKPSQRYEMKITRDGYVSLRIRVAFPEDAGHYTCCATNLAGRQTSSAELYIEGIGAVDETSYVTPDTLRRILRSPSDRRGSHDPGGVSEKYFKPIFRKTPPDQEVNEGQMCRMDCVVTGRPAPELFWYRDGQQVHDDNMHKIVINEDGINSLIIHATSKYDSGQYTCIARNRGGEDQFITHLNVIPHQERQPPRFVERMDHQTVREGEPATFHASAFGVPVPMMSWQRDGKMLTTDDHYKIHTEKGASSLHIPAAAPYDNAWFQCIAASVAGTASNRARLVVQVEARKPEPERKLFIPRRLTPTPPLTSEIYRATHTFSPPVRPTYRRGSDSDRELTGYSSEQEAGVVKGIRRPRGRSRSSSQENISLYSPIPFRTKPIPMWTPHTQGVAISQPAPSPILTKPEPVYRMAQAPPPEQQVVPSGAPVTKFGDSTLLKLIQEQEKHWTRDVSAAMPRPASEPTKPVGRTPPPVERSRADIVLSPTPPPKPPSPVTWRPISAPVVQPEVQQPAYAPPIVPSEAHIQLSREEPTSDEMYRKDRPRAPTFRTQIQPQVNMEEGKPAHFECRLVPIGDPDMVIEWFQNGKPLLAGHRFRQTHDFGYVALDIMYTYPEDSGNYTCVARNKYGEDRTSTLLTCAGKQGVITETQIPDGGERVKSLLRMEEQIKREQVPKQKLEIVPDNLPPVFDLLPEPQQVDEGDCAKFMVKVGGHPRPRLTWWVNGAIIVSGHRFRLRYDGMIHILEIPKAREYDSGTVRVVAKNPMGEAECSTSLTVLPKDDWRSRLKQAPAMEERHIEIRSTEIARQYAEEQRERTEALLHMKTPEQVVEHRKLTQVHVERKDPPTFTKPLSAVNVREGGCAKLEVEFVGYPPPQIQWFREGFEIQPSRDFQILNTPSKSILYIPELFPEDTGMFEVRATNPYGMAQCKNMLTVQEDIVKEKETPPEFRVQMRDMKIHVGEPATFDCQVVGNPRPEIYWTKDGRRLGDSPRWKFIVEEERCTLLIYEVRLEDRGIYECVVLNKLGKATCSARLTVEGKVEVRQVRPIEIPVPHKAPQLIEPLRDQSVDEGQPATFRCKIVATPDPVVQWYYDNQVIKPSKYFQMRTENGVHTLTITGSFPEDEGVYKCTARNQAGEVTCIAHLKVNPIHLVPEEPQRAHQPPRFTKPIAGLDVAEGQPARFEAIVEGIPAPHVNWYREGHQIVHSTDFQITVIETRHILTIKSVVPEDSGIFTCRASNPAGVAECSAELFVEDVRRVTKTVTKVQRTAPRIIKAPSPIREVTPGVTTRLVVQIAAFPPPRFTWFQNGQQVKPSQRFKVSYENGIITLVILNVQVSDAGDYILKAANDLGECTWKTTLNVKPTEKLVQLPKETREVTITSRTTTEERKTIVHEVVPTFIRPLRPEMRVAERSVARLECGIQASPPPHTITWHVNGVELKPTNKYQMTVDGSTAVLQVHNTAPSDTGVYTCRAISELGEAVTSTTLYVEVFEPPPEPPKFVVQLKSLTATDGEEVILTSTVKGRPTPEVSWFHNDRCIDKCEDFVITYEPNTGKCECVIVECLPDDQGVFKCIARNKAGQAITTATLTVKPPPRKEEPQIRPEVQAPVAAAPREPETVPVQRDTVVKKTEIEEKTETTTTETETQVDKEVKVIKKIVKRDSGEPPRFAKPIQPQVVREGETCIFSAVITGAPSPTIVWLKDKKEFTPNSRTKMEFDAPTMTCKLTITGCTQEDVGVYSCRAMNPAGKATCTANVVVVPPDAEVTVTEKTMSVKKEKVTVVGDQESRVVETSPQFESPLPPQINVTEGSNATMETIIVSEPEATVTWYKNGIELAPTVRTTILLDKGVSTLQVLGVTPQDSGEYICKATNPLGEATSRTVLNVKSLQKEPVPVPSPKGVGEPPITPEAAPPARAPQPTTTPDVPPAPLTEPCAVISATHEQVTMEIEMPTEPEDEDEPPKFTLPLRNMTANDGDRAIFRVMFTGRPSPKVTWFFNSKPIRPSKDFQVNVDIQRGESTLVIVEVFPEDEGEYMCKAENLLGAAVTHCHLFVKLPSSEEDETVEKIVSKTTETLTTMEPVHIKETARFTETVAVEHKGKMPEVQMQFELPEQRRQRTELQVEQKAVQKGTKMHVEIPQQHESKKLLALKRQVEAQVTKREELKIPLIQQRRFSETISVDHHSKPKEMEVQFALPKPKKETSAIEVRQQAALKGVKMEVEIAEQRRETSQVQITQKQRAEAIETKRHEMQFQLEGSAPEFVISLDSQKVMDGEEAKLLARVVGNPMPEITFFHDDKQVVDNPDFRTYYNKKTGEIILHIMEVFPQDTGVYECVAKNPYGQATCSANLTVEVFEYVPDSEEASQSESVLSADRHVLSSEDETEFIERTQQFIANMQKLREEIHEETVHEEEIPMIEEFEEETIAMADVKWFVPKHARTETVITRQEITQEMVTEVTRETTRTKDVEIALAQPSVSQKPATRVLPQQARTPEEIAEDLIASAATESTQQEKIVVDLATHEVKAKPASQVQPVIAKMAEEMTEEIITSAVTETSEEKKIEVELGQAAAKAKPETQVQPVVEKMAEEITQEVTETTTETTQEGKVEVELAQPSVQAKPASQVQPQPTQAPEEVSEVVIAPAASETTQEEEYTVELEKHGVQAKPATQVQPVEEKTAEEITHEVTETTTETTQEEHVQVELAQPSVQAKPASQVQPQPTQAPEEVTEVEIAPAASETMQEEEYKVDLSQPGVQAKPATQVQPVEERTAEEIIEDLVAQAPSETTQEQEIVVELAQPTQEQAKPSQVQPVEEKVSEEIIEDIVAQAPTETTQEQEIVVELAQPMQEQAKPTQVQPVEERVSEEAAEEIQLTTSETTDGKEVELELVQHIVEVPMETRVLTQEEQRTEETIQDILERVPSPEAAAGTEIQVDLAKPEVRKEESKVDIVLEQVTKEEEEDLFFEAPEPSAPIAEVTVDLGVVEVKQKETTLTSTQEAVTSVEITEETQLAVAEELPKPEEIAITLAKAEKEQPKPSMVTMQETVTVPVIAEELVSEKVTEEVSQESKIEVILEKAEAEAPKPSLVSTQESKVEIQITQEDIQEVAHEFTIPEEIMDETAKGETQEKPVSQVEPSTQVVAPELIHEEITGIQKSEIIAEMTPQVEMLAAELAQHIVRAVTEVTHEEEEVTETVKEVVEVIEKPEEVPQALMAPVFTIPLNDITVSDGEKATFECRVVGVPMPEVTWYINNQEIKPSADFKVTFIEGLCLLDIVEVFPEDEGEYSVKAVNEAGSCVTTAYLTVLPASRPDSEIESPEVQEPVMAPKKPDEVHEEIHKAEVSLELQTKKISVVEVPIPSQPEAPRFIKQLDHKEIFETLPVTLDCTVTGNPEPEITWYQDGKKITTSEHMTLYYEKGRCSLTIDRVTTEDEGEYVCEAKNEMGMVTTVAELLVEKLVGAVEQVVFEEYWEVQIELAFKWRLKSKPLEAPEDKKIKEIEA